MFLVAGVYNLMHPALINVLENSSVIFRCEAQPTRIWSWAHLRARPIG
jgi:hypothetical protein